MYFRLLLYVDVKYLLYVDCCMFRMYQISPHWHGRNPSFFLLCIACCAKVFNTSLCDIIIIIVFHSPTSHLPPFLYRY